MLKSTVATKLNPTDIVQALKSNNWHRVGIVIKSCSMQQASRPRPEAEEQQHQRWRIDTKASALTGYTNPYNGQTADDNM